MPQVSAGQKVTAAELSQAYVLADSNSHTVTAGSGSALDLSTVYTIPAFDAAAGQLYELTAWGNGTWGSTPHKLTLWTALAGSPLGAGSAVYDGAFPASQIFRWNYTARLICVSTGTAGTWLQQGSGAVAVYATSINPGTAASNGLPLADSLSSAITQDTTVANSFSVQAIWGGSTCTITCHGTKFTRCG